MVFVLYVLEISLIEHHPDMLGHRRQKIDQLPVRNPRSSGIVWVSDEDQTSLVSNRCQHCCEIGPILFRRHRY